MMKLRSLFAPAAIAAAAASLVVVAGATPASAQQPQQSPQQVKARQTVAQCLDRVITDLARSKASEQQVAATVLSRCDKPLRDVLAAVIADGQAASCTVESCIAQAQARFSQEAVQTYRQRVGG